MAGAVLIVDDDRAVIETLATILPPEVEVTSAADPQSAAAVLEQEAICGLILDLMLVDGDGFEVLRHMRERQMVIPTVVVTENPGSRTEEMLDEERVKLVLPKPVEPRLLAAVVRGLCGIA